MAALPSHENLAQYMGEALEEARAAGEAGDVPVGAIVVLDDVIIGRGRNRRVADDDPLAHAEVEAIRAAAAHVGRWRLDGATLVVTLEPCPMCAGALVQSRVSNLAFGAFDAKAGGVRSVFQICEDRRLPHRLDVSAGGRAEECSQVLRDFFSARRG